jgi:hypothetical protein
LPELPTVRFLILFGAFEPTKSVRFSSDDDDDVDVDDDDVTNDSSNSNKNNNNM